jgi:hypothetical protein
VKHHTYAVDHKLVEKKILTQARLDYYAQAVEHLILTSDSESTNVLGVNRVSTYGLSYRRDSCTDLIDDFALLIPLPKNKRMKCVRERSLAKTSAASVTTAAAHEDGEVGDEDDDDDEGEDGSAAEDGEVAGEDDDEGAGEVGVEGEDEVVKSPAETIMQSPFSTSSLSPAERGISGALALEVLDQVRRRSAITTQEADTLFGLLPGLAWAIDEAEVLYLAKLVDPTYSRPDPVDDSEIDLPVKKRRRKSEKNPMVFEAHNDDAPPLRTIQKKLNFGSGGSSHSVSRLRMLLMRVTRTMLAFRVFPCSVVLMLAFRVYPLARLS